MSKARQIKELLKAGKQTREIAGIVGCLPEYVRVVRLRQRGGGKSFSDRLWKLNNPDKVLAHKRKYRDVRYHAVPIDERFALAREVRLAARAAGLDTAQASSRASIAVMRRGAELLRGTSK